MYYRTKLGMVKATSFLVVALLMIMVAPVFGVTIIIDDYTSGFSVGGDWKQSSATKKTVNHEWAQNNTTDSVSDWAQWAPVGQPGFTAGQYYVQVNWGIWVGVDTAANYTVHSSSGDTVVSVNMQQFAAQGVIDNLVSADGGAAPKNGDESGWYTLGKFTLDDSSYVRLTQSSSGDPALLADAVRFSSAFENSTQGDGLIIDELSGKVTFTAGTGPWKSNNSSISAPESLNYRVGYGNNAKAVYMPGYSGQAGLSLSWGAYPSYHTTDANYLIDLDGNQDSTEDQTLIVINQTTLADGSTPPSTATCVLVQPNIEF